MRPTLITVTLLAFVACSHHDQTPGVDEYIIDCESASSGQTFASDETYIKMSEAESARRVISDPCNSPELTAPDSSARLSAATPPTFNFRPTHVSCAGAALYQPERRGCKIRRTSSSAWLAVLSLGANLLEGTAEAHCPALTGENYLFRITGTGESAAFYTAMLSVTSFTPDRAIWTRAMSGRAGQTVSLTIERAVFVRGGISEGPYLQPQPYSFAVGP